MKRIVVAGMLLTGLLAAQTSTGNVPASAAPAERAQGQGDPLADFKDVADKREAEYQKEKGEMDKAVARVDHDNACLVQMQLTRQMARLRAAGDRRIRAFGDYYKAMNDYYQSNKEMYTQEVQDIAAEKDRIRRDIEEAEASLKVTQKRQQDMRDNTVLSAADKEEQLKRLGEMQDADEERIKRANQALQATEERDKPTQGLLEKNTNMQMSIENFDSYMKSVTANWEAIYKKYQSKVNNDCVPAPPPRPPFSK